MKSRTGRRKAASSRAAPRAAGPTRRAMPTMRSPSSTGSCETSYSFMRAWATSKRVVGRDRDHRALLVAARDHVAQVAARRPAQEALVAHPEVVEHLRQVLVAAVADEGDDPLGRRLLAAVAQRRRDQRARRRAGQDALVAQQRARRHEALLVGDGVGLLHARQIADGRHEVLADALDQPGAGLRRSARSARSRRAPSRPGRRAPSRRAGRRAAK